VSGTDPRLWGQGRGALVLSVFPGIDVLGMGFEQEGFCVVRGPDPLFGGDVRDFHPPAGVFVGVIGGPPCQSFSQVKKLNPLSGTRDGDLIPEFCRVVSEAAPRWWLMENVPESTTPQVPYYKRHSLRLNNRQMAADPEGFGGIGPEQQRVRLFHFGTLDGRRLSLHVAPQANAATVPTVLAGHGPTKWGRKQLGHTFPGGRPTLAAMCLWQGLPEDFHERLPFTVHDKQSVIGNAVPLYLGRELARAIKRAYHEDEAPFHEDERQDEAVGQ
jgi:DNA (cytosine-5)-methyltransferase 1